MDNEPGSLAHHFERLIADADDVTAMLHAHHSEGVTSMSKRWQKPSAFKQACAMCCTH